MALPANIRVNLAVPFPAMVQGSGPITITKVNGVWTIGFTVAGIQSIAPPAGDFPTDFLFGFDAKRGQFFQLSLTNLLGILPAPISIRPQRLVTASPIVIAGGDQILNVNIAAGAPTCTLPAAASRGGSPVTFKDVGGNFAAHNLTITPNAGDAIDGGGSIVLNVNRQAVTLVPANDGTSTGWFIE